MPHPEDKKGVERLLGSVNYLAKFVPNISTIIEPIRQLLKNDVEFEWSTAQKESFVKIKAILSSEAVLKFFDPTQPITVSCDASKSGLGAALLQNNKPISFASRSMTETETGYAQIEKMQQKMLAEGQLNQLVSDNGPNFASSEFQQFAKAWDFKHTTSSPHYPQSNGLAERYVSIIKKILQKHWTVTLIHI